MKFLLLILASGTVAMAADVKISDLPQTNTPSATAVMSIVDAGVTWKYSLGNLVDWQKLGTNVVQQVFTNSAGLIQPVQTVNPIDSFQFSSAYTNNNSPAVSFGANVATIPNSNLPLLVITNATGQLFSVGYNGSIFAGIDAFNEYGFTDNHFILEHNTDMGDSKVLGIVFENIDSASFSTVAAHYEDQILSKVDTNSFSGVVYAMFVTNQVWRTRNWRISVSDNDYHDNQPWAGSPLAFIQDTAYATYMAPALMTLQSGTPAAHYYLGTVYDTGLDLFQVAKSNNPVAFSVSSSGLSKSLSGFSSTAVDAIVAFTTTGITNALGKQAVARFDGTAITYVVKNNANTPQYTNQVAVGHATEILQAGGAIMVTGGSGVTGTLAPF